MVEYYCGQRQKMLAKDEMEWHGCLARRKGHRKGKPCKYLVKM